MNLNLLDHILSMFLLFPSEQNKFSHITNAFLTLLHSELPKLYGVLAVLSAIGLIMLFCQSYPKGKHNNKRVSDQSQYHNFVLTVRLWQGGFVVCFCICLQVLAWEPQPWTHIIHFFGLESWSSIYLIFNM